MRLKWCWWSNSGDCRSEGALKFGRASRTRFNWDRLIAALLIAVADSSAVRLEPAATRATPNEWFGSGGADVTAVCRCVRQGGGPRSLGRETGHSIAIFGCAMAALTGGSERSSVSAVALCTYIHLSARIGVYSEGVRGTARTSSTVRHSERHRQ